jgi:2-methylcitrate dehydratase PrpD
MQGSATLALAERIAATDHDRIPGNAREVGRQALLDFIGVTLAGSDEPLSRILREEARDAGGTPQALFIGTGERGNVAQAALINGAAGHAHDYDDVHSAMSGHPTVPVAPVVLALGEHLGRDGRDLVTAFCVGVDTECIVGRYAGHAHYARGWHNTGTIGSFGAAAAAAWLRGLDAEATARALGIAGTQAAGLKAQFGTMCKPLHAGHAAATGAGAADLAARGFTSRTDLLETPQGFMATQADGASLERFAAALAVPSFTQDICFKYHAACYLTHGAMEALGELRRNAQLAADDVEMVEIRVNQGHFGVCNIPAPTTGLEAKFSLRQTGAMTLAGVDTASIDIFTDDVARRPDLVALRERIRVVAHDVPRPETVVTVTTRDGRTLSAAADVAIPLTDLDLQWRKLEQKFMALTVPRLGPERARAIVRACRALDADVRPDDFFPLLRGNS